MVNYTYLMKNKLNEIPSVSGNGISLCLFVHYKKNIFSAFFTMSGYGTSWKRSTQQRKCCLTQALCTAASSTHGWTALWCQAATTKCCVFGISVTRMKQGRWVLYLWTNVTDMYIKGIGLSGLSVCLSVCLPVCLSVCLPVSLSLSVCVSLSGCLFVCLSLSLSVCVSLFLVVCLSVCLSVSLSFFVSLSVSHSPPLAKHRVIVL